MLNKKRLLGTGKKNNMELTDHKIELERIPKIILEKPEGIPSYVRICDIFVKMTENGDVKPGEILPGENILASYWDVSRATVRRAFRNLEDDGYVNKRQGRGTIIASRASAQHPSIHWTYNLCLGHCVEPITEVRLQFAIEKCGEYLAGLLQMEPGSEIAAAYFHYDTAHGPVSSSSVLMSRKVFEANIADTADQNKVRTFLLETIYSSALNSETIIQAYSRKMQHDPSIHLENAEVIFSILEILRDSSDRPFAQIKYHLDSAFYRLQLNRRARVTAETG